MPAPAAPARPAVSQELIKAFQEAMAAQGNFDKMEETWSKAIALAPDNAAAWSNRGTARLQAGRWRQAYEDLLHACDLEAAQNSGEVSSLLLNNLGNAEGALDLWDDAMGHYRRAAADPDLEAIATANYALAAFQVGPDWRNAPI
jgi:tetratricopeptide (TPR) repeat protein